jgi:hypothetical protein
MSEIGSYLFLYLELTASFHSYYTDKITNASSLLTYTQVYVLYSTVN